MKSIISILVIFWCVNVLGAVRFLDSNANGANNGTNWINAYTNAQTAAAALKTGDTLWIQSGDYRVVGQYPTATFSGKNNIKVLLATNAIGPAVFDTIKIYNCDNSYFDGSSGTNRWFRLNGVLTSVINSPQHALFMKQTTNTLIAGFHVDRSVIYTNDVDITHGICIDDGYDLITVSNCYVTQTSGDGVNWTGSPIKITNSWDRHLLISCVIENLGDDGCQFGYPYGNTAINNVFNSRNHPAMFGGHRDGIQVNPGNSYNRIVGNFFSNYTQSLFIEKAKGPYIVSSNIFVDTHTNSSYSGLGCGATNDFEFVIIKNNVFYGFLAYAGWKGGDTILNVSNRFIQNNVFVNCKQVCIYGVYEPYWKPNDGNFWWDEPDVTYYDSNGNVVVRTDANAGEMAYADPLFVNSTNWNFQLRIESPLLGAATNITSVNSIINDK